jgi:PadR family transcriptional regulator PadR
MGFMSTDPPERVTPGTAAPARVARAAPGGADKGRPARTDKTTPTATAEGLRLTVPVLKVLRFLLDAPEENFWGFEIMKATHLASGTVYQILIRLETMGWLQSGWDEEDTPGPRRRYYRFTSDGGKLAGVAVARADSKKRAAGKQAAPTSVRLRPALGGG